MVQSNLGAAALQGSPTVPPPAPEGLTPVLGRNIRALHARRREEEKSAGWQERAAKAVTAFTGSMSFVGIHVALFGFWAAANLKLIPGVQPWDESFVILGTSASVEAIFLSTFVLISQNRMAELADKRADLDLQINLLSEHEVTRLMALVSAVADKLGVATEVDEEVDELKRDIAPEAVLTQIEAERAKEEE
jgi:uncharacterized membrane protein